MIQRTAIFPGSFDPFTRGHEALIHQALRLFDKVIVGIGNNPSKEGLLTVEARKRLIDDYYAGNARVEAMSYGGMTGDFAQQVGAAAVIRGVRNTTDFDVEYQMALINRGIHPELETLLLPASAEYQHFSSSMAREMIRYHQPLEKYLPASIVPLVREMTEKKEG